MISNMDKRVAGVVALLGLAFATASRPALAQDGNSWFDDGSGNDQPAPVAMPPQPPQPPQPTDAPVRGPRPEVPYGAAPSAPGPQAPPQQADDVPETDPRAITEFRSTLDPYGSWVEDEKYGTVWVPNRDAVGDDFAPYVSAGHWALTEDGDWIWQSDYPFGGVVFHYGRWVWVPGTGWAWVAGRRYANAWVTWRVSTDDYGYIGWAPMAPSWGWYGGSAVSLWWYPPTAYVFCPNRYAFSYRVHSYIVHDRYVIHDVASHTRNYYDGRVQHVAAQPRVLPANSPAPRGPSLQSARIPASAAPMSRVPMRSAFAGARSDGSFSGARAADYNRRSFSNGARPASPASYQQVPGSYRSPNANPSSYARPRPSYTAPITSGYRTPGAAPRSYSLPSNTATRYSAPSTYRAVPSPAYRAPSFNASPAYRSAPSFNSSPTYRSAPSFNSAPTFHSAPAFHSAPTFHSAPSFHSGGRR
jgi:hypothetical protein